MVANLGHEVGSGRVLTFDGTEDQGLFIGQVDADLFFIIDAIALNPGPIVALWGVVFGPTAASEFELSVRTIDEVADGMNVCTWYACVARTVKNSEVKLNEKAQKAVDAEWDQLTEKKCWLLDKVEPWEVAAERARKSGIAIHVGRVFQICVEKRVRVGRRRPGARQSANGPVPREF